MAKKTTDVKDSNVDFEVERKDRMACPVDAGLTAPSKSSGNPKKKAKR